MNESQRTEWKESWRDEHLRHICAFANAQGGMLIIGVRDDGEVVGARNAKKLLEDIPNKAVQLLGVTVSARVRREDGKDVVEIAVPASSVPISLHGRFYLRSGSTSQELRGHELRDFILRKDNLTWDEIAVPGATMKDLDEIAIVRFAARAALAHRLPYDAAQDDPESVLGKLGLVSDGGELTRAAVLLFGRRPRKHIRSAQVKIGRFGKSPADLISHDVIEGNLLDMPETIMSILRTKYLHSPISYEGLVRKETLEYPEKALREAILNAIVHRDYGVDTDITISIYADRITIWNFGALMAPLTVEMLKKEHPSRRRNSLVAEAFFRAGHIEAWGRGIAMMVGECRSAGLPEPKVEEYAGGVQITFPGWGPGDEGVGKGKTREKTGEKTREKTREKTGEKIISLLEANPRMTQAQLVEQTGLSRGGVEWQLKSLKAEGILRRVGPAKGGYWEVLRK
jgi:ATP-dependent DNA helicase RecG